jgi:hypothetical protein
MNDAYNVGFKDGASAGYKLAIEDMKLDKKPQIMKKYEGDYAVLEARHNALREAVAWERECQLVRHYVIFEALETCALREITRSISAARADVDALVGEG